MNHFRSPRLAFALILGSVISPFGVASALALEGNHYHYSAKDLREVPENLACLQIKKALVANPGIVPISGAKENCLRTIVDEAPACQEVWSWRDSKSCQGSQSFMIKNTASTEWKSCLLREAKYKAGMIYSREVLKCGRSYFSGAPNFEDIVLKSTETPGSDYYSGTVLYVTNPEGESERYNPIHSYIKKLVVSTKPVTKKDNLTTKYYFPVEIVVLAKYQPEDLSSVFYVKRTAEFLVQLGSSKKPLQN